MLGDQGWLLVAALCLALPGYAAWFAVRGELAGQAQLTRYGVQLVARRREPPRRCARAARGDRPTRLMAGFGLLFGLSPWLTLALTLPGWRLRPSDRAPVDREPLTRPLVLLVVSALAAQLLINAGPLVVTLLAAPSESGTSPASTWPCWSWSGSRCSSSAAVQPGYLRALVGARRLRRHARRSSLLLRLVLAAVVATSAVLCVAATALAPPVVSWLFDFDQQLSRSTCLLLTVSVGLFLVGVVLAQALLGPRPATCGSPPAGSSASSGSRSARTPG